MSEIERNEMYDKIANGLRIANENMLRTKKARGEKVTYVRESGKIYTVTARTALKRYLASKQAD